MFFVKCNEWNVRDNAIVEEKTNNGEKKVSVRSQRVEVGRGRTVTQCVFRGVGRRANAVAGCGDINKLECDAELVYKNIRINWNAFTTAQDTLQHQSCHARSHLANGPKWWEYPSIT